MPLDRRLKRGLSTPIVGIDVASLERDLHEVVQRGRRRRRNRRLAAVVATVAIVVGIVVLAPRALDAFRSLGEPRPAAPLEPEGIPGVITTVAGVGLPEASGDGGPATAAAIHYPFDLVMDEAGNLYVAETMRIRKIDASGRIMTIVGPPADGDEPTLTEANRLRLGGQTNALAIDAEGNLYVGGGDGDHFVVNKISPSGQVTRIAGTGRRGFSGDGGPAIEAELGWVYDLAVDPAGNVYLVDADHHRIRMVDTTGVITTVAGTGRRGYSGDGGLATDARLYNPAGIDIDPSGNIYFADNWNNVIRRIDASTRLITTIAGNGRQAFGGDGGPAIRARFNHPEHVEVGEDGTVYIEDTGNHCIRMVDPTGTITTVVGICESGFGGDGGPASAALLSEPSGMLLTPDGVLYIADSANNRVRRVIL
jgi:DNA-binding beta-propeller fold protein YncE